LGGPVASVVYGGLLGTATVLEAYAKPTVTGLSACVGGALGGSVPWARMEPAAAGTCSAGSPGKELPSGTLSTSSSTASSTL
jgi:hypothetical protein